MLAQYATPWSLLEFIGYGLNRCKHNFTTPGKQHGVPAANGTPRYAVDCRRWYKPVARAPPPKG